MCQKTVISSTRHVKQACSTANMHKSEYIFANAGFFTYLCSAYKIFLMFKARHKDIRPVLKICEWLLIMLICIGVAFGIWQWLPVNHASTGAMLLFQALQAIGLFIVPAFAVAYLWSDQPLQWLLLTTPEHNQLDGKSICLSIGIMISAIPLINCLVAWNESIRLPENLSGLEQIMQQMEHQTELILQRFMTYKDGAWWALLLNLVVLAILPGIGEELAFRGVLQSFFRNRHTAVWVTAFIFSFMHFQFYGFIPRMLMGALLGYALVWSGRIGYSIIMHVTNNAMSVLVFYLGTYQWHLSQDEIDAIGTGHTWWITLLCTPVMIALLYLYYRRTQALTPSSDHFASDSVNHSVAPD